MAKQSKYEWQEVKVLINGKQVKGIISIALGEHEINDKRVYHNQTHDIYNNLIKSNSELKTINKKKTTMKNEFLNKFENGHYLYSTNHVFNTCVNQLLQGADVYKLLEQIVVMQSNTQKRLNNLVESGTLRQEIIVSKEQFDKLKEEYETPESLLNQTDEERLQDLKNGTSFGMK